MGGWRSSLAGALRVALVPALAACFGSTNAGLDGGVTPPVDAASGPQPVGAPCDPAIATPCFATGDSCLGVYCDPDLRVCTEYDVTDAGPLCTGAGPCTGSADCDVGLTCGFPLGAGCSATGVCINVPLECEDDAAACPTGGTVCGCSGQPVSFVIPGYATGPTPVAGTGPAQGICTPADAGPGADAGDAGGSGDGSVGP